MIGPVFGKLFAHNYLSSIFNCCLNEVVTIGNGSLNGEKGHAFFCLSGVESEACEGFVAIAMKGNHRQVGKNLGQFLFHHIRSVRVIN